MATMVSIQIRVDDGNTGAVIDGINAKLSQLGVQGTASMKKLGSAVDNTSGSVSRTATVGAPAIRWMNQMQESSGHTTTAIDNIRLAAQSLGLRLPRALESAFSRMPAIAGALSGLGAGLIALGSVEALAHLGTELYDLEQKFISIQAPVDKFYESLKKASELDFTNTKSLETTARRMAESQHFSNVAPSIAGDMQKSGIVSLLQGNVYGLADVFGARKVAEGGANASQQTLDLTKQDADQAHQRALAQIELNHAMDGTLQRGQQIAAENRKQREVAAENRLYATRVEGFYGNPTPKNAGAETQRMADEAADKEAASKTIALNQEVSIAIMKARDQATQSGLQGEALYQAKQKDGIREITAELQAQHMAYEIPARVQALTTQYENERIARLRSLTEQTDKLAEATKLAGMPEAGKINAEHDFTIGNIDKAQRLATVGGKIDPAVEVQFAKQRQDADDTRDQKQREIERQFTSYVKGQIDERTAAQLQGFAKIDAETQRALDAAKSNFTDKFGRDGQYANRSETDAYAAQVQNIKSGADAQKSQLRQRNADEDLQYEREAAESEKRIREQGIMGWVAAYKNGVAEINAVEDARMAKLTSDKSNGLIEWDDFTRRKAAIEQSANAQIAEQNANLQHQIAGQLQSAFTDPTAFIKQKMEQMFFEIIAAWITRTQLFKQFFGSTMGSMQPGASSAPSGFGGILGNALGLHPAAAGLPTGTAGVIRGGTSLPSGYSSAPGVSSTVGPDGTVRPGGASSTYSPMATIQGVSNVAKQITQLAKGNGGKPGAADTDTDESSLDAWLNGGSGSPGAMQGVGGAPSLAGAMNSVAGFGALAYGAYSGTQGVIDSFHKGGVGGALSGTMSGAEMGAAIGSIVPGLGTAVGAVVGAAIGLGTKMVGDILGESGRFAARDYYKQTLFPQMEQIENSYNSGTGADFLNGISQANSTASAGYAYMAQKWGTSAADWVKSNYLDKETSKVIQDITALAGGGHQYTARSAAQFHGGGPITSFGDLATSPSEGYVHALMGEHMIKPVPAQTHAPFLHAINSGADAVQMAGMYLQAAGMGSSPAMGSGSGETHLHVHTLDTKTMTGWLRNGGAKMITNAQNDNRWNYGGDSVG